MTAPRKITRTREIDAQPLPCLHPHKKRCGRCGEAYCPNDGCDPYHIQACADAAKP